MKFFVKVSKLERSSSNSIDHWKPHSYETKRHGNSTQQKTFTSCIVDERKKGTNHLEKWKTFSISVPGWQAVRIEWNAANQSTPINRLYCFAICRPWKEPVDANTASAKPRVEKKSEGCGKSGGIEMQICEANKIAGKPPTYSCQLQRAGGENSETQNESDGGWEDGNGRKINGMESHWKAFVNAKLCSPALIGSYFRVDNLTRS